MVQIPKLLGRTSSINVRKVMWTAAEIGVDYVHAGEWATPAASPRSGEFLRLNPNGLVPVWVDHEGPLWESNTICRYLAASHGRSDLLPDAPRHRAEVEKWMDWGSGDLNAAWRFPFMWLVRRNPDYDDQGAVARGITAWNEHMRTLDAHLQAGGPFAAGESFTLADVVLGLSVHRWLHTPIERPELSNLEAYVGRLQGRPAFALLAPPDQP